MYRFVYSQEQLTHTSIRLKDLPALKLINQKTLSEAIKQEVQAAEELYETSTSTVLRDASKKAWDISWSPIKTLSMNLIMLYFSGSSPSIFTILVLSYTLYTAFVTLASVFSVFKPIESSVHPDILKQRTFGLFIPQKLIYVFISIVICCYIVLHVVNMSLLPLKTGDYISLIPAKLYDKPVLFSF